MLCPNCKSEMKEDFCIKCGYMNNGNFINQHESQDKYQDIKIYNKQFETMNRNQKKWLNLILGPFYFSYRSHILVGTIIGIIDFLIFILTASIISALISIGNIYCLFAYFIIVFYVLTNRIMYMTFSNYLCIKIDDIKIKKIKKHHQNYTKKLQKHKSSSIIYILINILIYIIPIVIILYKYHT